eukprot:5932992-Prorocentrum_lima.AAC.1
MSLPALRGGGGGGHHKAGWAGRVGLSSRGFFLCMYCGGAVWAMEWAIGSDPHPLVSYAQNG